MITSWSGLLFVGLLFHAFVLPSSSWVSIPPTRLFNQKLHCYSKVSNDDDEKLDLNLLLLDHYDSYTYNLYDQIAQLCHKPPIVLTKDAASTWSELQVLLRETHNIRRLDGVILSPGPGKPSVNDLGADIIRCNPTLPILGVCLGHQMMAIAYFERDDVVICAQHGPVHGHVHSIHHDSVCPLFRGISSPFPATRYHSLVVQMPSCSSQEIGQRSSQTLQATAFCYEPSGSQTIVMGLAHSSNPHYGVQFHPESIGTQPHGHTITRNFLHICKEFRLRQPPQHSTLSRNSLNFVRTGPVSKPITFPRAREEQQVYVYKVPNLSKQVSPQQVFASLMADEPYAVWLDGTNHHQPTQSSILACYRARGNGGHRVEYYGQEHENHLRGLYIYRPNVNREVVKNRRLNVQDEVCERNLDLDILSFLKREHSYTNNHVHMITFSGANGAAWIDPQVEYLTEVDVKHLLPFDFRGGHIGYLGYEVRHDIERRMVMSPAAEINHQSYNNDDYKSRNRVNENKAEGTHREPFSSTAPTAAFIFAHESLVYDPNQQEWYLVGVLDSEYSSKEKLFRWFQNTETSLQRLGNFQLNESVNAISVSPRIFPPPTMSSGHFAQFSTLRPKATYQRNIAECHEFIRLGESYELCLTNQLTSTVHDSDQQRSAWDLYQILRRRNPAPFSAFLNWNSQRQPVGDTLNDDRAQRPQTRLAICCSSPERFVSVQRPQSGEAWVNDSGAKNPTFIVEAKPIKGTCARVQPNHGNIKLTPSQHREDARRALDLQSSVKNRAENLMIVDLLRNDLSRVCRVGSVHVPKLMHVESYTTVHQLVSTIRGTLDADKTAVDVLEACFPGGSMTGAPKLRTLGLLDQLEEGHSRGPYSGCLGYISSNGAMDMNIVIRSAVLTPSADSQTWNVSVGAGGAITALSESDDEYDEMLLKAKAVMEAVQEWALADRIAVGESLPIPEQVQQLVSSQLNTTWLER